MFPGNRSWLFGATLDDEFHEQEPPPKPSELLGSIGFALFSILYMALVIVALVSILTR
jgi:hypothetical protein